MKRDNGGMRVHGMPAVHDETRIKSDDAEGCLEARALVPDRPVVP